MACGSPRVSHDVPDLKHRDYMIRGENTGNGDCSRTDSTECKGYAREQSTEKPESGETEIREPGLLEAILDRENLNRAYKRVKANKGAPGIDGITVDEIGAYLKEHQQEIIAKKCK